MTEPELGRVLRDTFRDHEHAVHGLRDGLLPAARTRARRRQWRRAGGAGLGAAAVVGLTIGLVAALGGPSSPSRGPGDAGRDTGGPGSIAGYVPDGWEYVSSLGLEIGVPGDWAVNDYGCHMSDRPSVVRGRGAVEACLTPEPATKRVAIIAAGPDSTYDDSQFTRWAVTINGEPGTRIEGRLPDGRYAGGLAVPGREVYLTVRTTDESELFTILATAHLVDVDHLGCTTRRPSVAAPETPIAGMAPTDPAAVRVCYYGSAGDGRLQASTELTRAEVRDLVVALNAAPPGRNPDPPPQSCHDMTPAAPDLVIQIVASASAGYELSRVWVTFSPCSGRGIDNGLRQSRISSAMIALMMNPLHSGYGFHFDLHPTVK